MNQLERIVAGSLAILISGCRGCRQDTNGNETPNLGEDSIPFTITDEQLLWTGNYADPSVIQSGGRFLMYLNTFVDTAGYLVFSSNDGLSWTKETDIIFPGIATGRAYVFPDGVRFYYPNASQSINVSAFAPGTEPKEIMSAFSSDGLSFVGETDIRISSTRENYSVWGPTVIQLQNGTYRMFFTEGNSSAAHVGSGAIYGASSEDGLNWTRDENVTLVAEEAYEGLTDAGFQAMHPFALPWQNDYLLFYSSNKGSKTYAAYSNDSYTWKKLNFTGIRGGDSDGYAIDNTTMRLYFGNYSPATGGAVYTCLLNIKIPAE